PDEMSAPPPTRPAQSPARLAPREVTMPGLSQQKVQIAGADLMNPVPQALAPDPRHLSALRDIHDELTNLADERHRPQPAGAIPRPGEDDEDDEELEIFERSGLPPEPAARADIEFALPADGLQTLNMRRGDDGAMQEISDPGARAPHGEIDPFAPDERASDDESTMVSPEPTPESFEDPATEAVHGYDAAALYQQALANEDPGAPEASAEPFEDERPTRAVDAYDLPAAELRTGDEGEVPGFEDALDEDAPGEDATAQALDVLARVDDDELALDLDDAFIQQLPRPPGMVDAHSAGMPEGSTPFASLLSGDMVVSAERALPARMLVSGSYDAAGEMIVSDAQAPAVEEDESEYLADDDELSEVSDRLRSPDTAAAEGDWVVSVPRTPPPLRRTEDTNRAEVQDDVAGLQMPALELPADRVEEKAPPPPTELKRKALRKPSAGARTDAPGAPRFFSGTVFFVVLLVALATLAAGAGAGFALVNAQKKAAPLTGPGKAKQLLGDAHRLLHEDRPREALDVLKRAAIDDPTLAEIQRALGTTHAKLGNEEEAARAYGYYVRLAPNAPDAEAIRLMLARHRGEEP
ncbi:MAG: tetratricopeptide repeat protein, partial [Pseudomonadota bacterium]